MASKNFTGYLRDPLSEFATQDLWTFTHLTTTGETVKGSVSRLRIPDDGLYNIDIQYGNVNIISKDTRNANSINHGTYTINSETIATTLPSLLNSTIPTTTAEILAMEALLQDAQDAADDSAASAASIAPYVDSVNAMTEADFFALAKQREDENNGSGFLHWGKVLIQGGYNTVSEGLYLNAGTENTLYMGCSSVNESGTSKTDAPVLIVSGARLTMDKVASSSTAILNNINFPPAPDGLDKKDGTGRFADLTAAIVAGGAGLTESSINPKDFTYLRAPKNKADYHNVSVSGYMYPLGNKQYGATTINGITTDGNQPAPMWLNGKYASDSGVTGNTISHAKILANPELFTGNNIYSRDGDLIQVTYDIYVSRTEEAYSDNPSIWEIATNESLNYDSESRTFYRTEDDGIEYWILPIALPQRRNQGAFHPSLNPDGCDSFDVSVSGNYRRYWSNSDAMIPSSISECFLDSANGGARTINTGGYIGSSPLGVSPFGSTTRPDGYFYDAIYAGDVDDLRFDCKKQNEQTLLFKEMRKAISGEQRGFEGVPFTRVFTTSHASTNQSVRTLIRFPTDTIFTVYGANTAGLEGVSLGCASGSFVVDEISQDGTSDYLYILGNHASEIVLGEVCTITDNFTTTSKSAEPIWTGVWGKPSDIEAAFPDGLNAVWLGTNDYSGTAATVPLQRKLEQAYSGVSTVDAGATWSSFNPTLDTTDNSIGITQTTNRVTLYSFKAKAHATQEDFGVTRITEWQNLVFATNNADNANLVSSLIGKVSTGSDNDEQLAITSIIDDVISHFAVTQTPDVLFTCALGHYNNVAYLMFNCDDSGVIDSSNIQVCELNCFIEGI